VCFVNEFLSSGVVCSGMISVFRTCIFSRFWGGMYFQSMIFLCGDVCFGGNLFFIFLG